MVAPCSAVSVQRVWAAEGALMGLATLAVVMVEGGGACLLTVAVRLLGGTETEAYALEMSLIHL